jgi:hypothetical protein
LCEEQEPDDKRNGCDDEPGNDLARNRLEQRDPSPLPMVLLKIDDFLSEQRKLR